MIDEKRTTPDPGIDRPPYKILMRTCGDYVVFDPRMPLGKNCAGGSDTVEGATAIAEALVTRGAPMEYVHFGTPEERAAKKKRRTTEKT